MPGQPRARSRPPRFHIFPLHPGPKIPAIKQWENEATCDQERVQRWSARWPEDNLLTGLHDDTPRRSSRLRLRCLWTFCNPL
ncbi:bifunctional DNA primase/polymerase [Nocardia sp. NPDC049190]|uniref:bifunctional DNA primase/polymerase n=1 Tax=Nocardia sp. NPDC049190 TaxID=3155650 RepID=UPI0033DBFF63